MTVTGYIGPYLVFLLAWLPISSAQQPSAENNGKVTVKGVVLDSLSKEPLRKVDLTLSRSARDDLTAYAAISSPDGTFIFEDVEPGKYYLWGVKLGYVEGRYGSSGPGSEGVELRISVGQTLDNLQLVLTPQAVISGRVVDQDGDPAGFSNVSLFSYIWRHGKRERQLRENGSVDDRAEFRFAGLTPGKYYLSAEPEQSSGLKVRSPKQKSRYGQVVTYYPGTLEEEDAMPITVTAGQQISNIEIKLQKGAVHSVKGKVLGLNEIPEQKEFYSGRHVVLQKSSNSGFSAVSFAAGVDTNGSFEIDKVQPGVYDLSFIQGPGWVTLARATVEVADRDIDNLTLQAMPPQPLSGKLRVDGKDKTDLSGVAIFLNTLDETFGGVSARVKSDGSFEFSAVGPGRYQLQIWNKPEATYLKSIRLGESESTDGTVDIVPGARRELNVVLGADGAEILGSIKSDSPDPDQPSQQKKTPKIVLIPDTPELRRREEFTREAVFDQYGAFTINGIAPGKYKLYAGEKIEEDAWENPDLLKQMEPNAVDVAVDANEKKHLQVSLIPAQLVTEAMYRAGIE